jgi:hypothetical protein
MYYAGIVHWITSSVPAIVHLCASAALQSHPVAQLPVLLLILLFICITPLLLKL